MSGFMRFEQILEASKAGRTPPLAYASPGEGSPHHLAMELLGSQTGLVANHVPYRGTGMALPDVVSGKVPMLVVDLAGGLVPTKGEAVVPVLSLSGRRISQLPEMPAVPDSVTGPLNACAAVGLVAPAATPMPMPERLNAELQTAMRVPKVSRKLNDAGWETAAADATLLRVSMAAERAIWPALIRDCGITVTQ